MSVAILGLSGLVAFAWANEQVNKQVVAQSRHPVHESATNRHPLSRRQGRGPLGGPISDQQQFNKALHASEVVGRGVDRINDALQDERTHDWLPPRTTTEVLADKHAHHITDKRLEQYIYNFHRSDGNNKRSPISHDASRNAVFGWGR